MTTLNKDDRFTIGNGITGTVVDSWRSNEGRTLAVEFDGHVGIVGTPLTNNFNADWLEARAEKIEPPLPLAIEVLPTLKPGDRFSVYTVDGNNVPGLVNSQYLAYVDIDEVYATHVGHVWVVSDHSGLVARRVAVSTHDRVKII